MVSEVADPVKGQSGAAAKGFSPPAGYRHVSLNGTLEAARAASRRDAMPPREGVRNPG